MKRLTKTYLDGTHGASDNLPCGENSYDYKNLLLEKLGKYEDLEERLNKVYGDCDELLESMIDDKENSLSTPIERRLIYHTAKVVLQELIMSYKEVQ